jgi:Xaa-Pro aminopeptidase
MNSKRLKLIRGLLKRYDINAVLLTHHSDLAWATGFTGHDSVGIVTAKDVIIVSDFRYQEQLKREAASSTVVMRDKHMLKALPEVLVKYNVSSLGFEAHFTQYGTIEAVIAGFDRAQKPLDIVPLDNVLVVLRSTKDASEVKTIRHAIAIAQDALAATLPTIKVGQTESHVAARLVYEMNQRGASGPSFEPIVSVGANSALPHYRAGSAKVEAGKVLLIDWGCVFEGYCSDLTRTYFVGKPHKKMLKVYELVLKAQETAIKKIRPGMTNHQADKIARDIIEKAGFGKLFGHGTGHGLGKDIHEEPRLNKLFDEQILEEGHVVTIEPGVYVPELGGVRIEDDVLLTSRGCEILTRFDKSLRAAKETLLSAL